MSPSLDRSRGRLLASGRRALTLSVPVLVVAAVLSAVASVPGGAATGVSGVSWSVVPGPATPPTQYDALSGVSCTSSTFCAAVGTVNEVWNGSAWSVVPSPAAGSQYNRVSCTSPSACMAVGSSGSESWNGSVWSSVPIGLPGTDAALSAVSCSGASACTAVGSFAPPTTCGPRPPCNQIYQATLIESWNGSAWSVVPSPNAPYYLADELNAVSCLGPSACTAVGGLDPVDRTLIESWNGSAWSIVPSPDTPDDQPNVLTGVSCSSSMNCTAVGIDAVDGLEDQTLIESWNGSVWSIVPSPDTSSIQNNNLSGVSCSGPSACTAAGTYSPYDPNQDPVELTLIESWNGSAWSIVPSPDPSRTERNSLSDVSCSSPSVCTAVGSLVPSVFAETAQPLIESSRSIRDGRAPLVTTGGQKEFTAGSNGTFKVRATGRPRAFLSESGSLPSGVTFVDNGNGTATLSGTPATGSEGPYPIVITASNGVSPDATQRFTLTVGSPPTTSVLIPSAGSSLSGVTYLDALGSNASSVEFRLFGGSFGADPPVICRATPTVYGWLCRWNTKRVPNGSYVLASEAFGPSGGVLSAGISITVDN